MTESSQHTSKPQVEVEASGGDDNKSARRGAIFIGVVLVGYIVYLVVTGQMGQFWAAMSSVQASWLVVACLCMFMYLFFGIVAYAIAVWLDPNSPVGIRDLISVEASGIFFGNLTPMMMGSTPAQIYRLTKAGQNVGEAGATQFTRFIVYQFGLVAWGAILLLARMPFFAERYGDMTLLCVFSFGGHCCILLGIFAVALMPKTVTRVAIASSIGSSALVSRPLRSRVGARLSMARSTPSPRSSSFRPDIFLPCCSPCLSPCCSSRFSIWFRISCCLPLATTRSTFSRSWPRAPLSSC